MTTIVRAVQTCQARPSQWDAWDSEGNYWYLRYRFGFGDATRYPGPNMSTWPLGQQASYSFKTDDSWSGEIKLEDFCTLAGIELQLA